jgi:hypothetical protein
MHEFDIVSSSLSSLLHTLGYDYVQSVLHLHFLAGIWSCAARLSCATQSLYRIALRVMQSLRSSSLV